MKKSDFTLKQQYEFVTGLYNGWKDRESKVKIFPFVEKLDGNVDLLAELTGEDFKDDEDLRRKVESWIEEKKEKLRAQAEKNEKYKKARFKKKLFETCLSRHKRKKK